MEKDYPKCTHCPKFNSVDCRTCIWNVEYELIQKYGSWEKAQEGLEKDVQEARQTTKRDPDKANI